MNTDTIDTKTPGAMPPEALVILERLQEQVEALALQAESMCREIFRQADDELVRVLDRATAGRDRTIREKREELAALYLQRDREIVAGFVAAMRRARQTPAEA